LTQQFIERNVNAAQESCFTRR